MTPSSWFAMVVTLAIASGCIGAVSPSLRPPGRHEGTARDAVEVELGGGTYAGGVAVPGAGAIGFGVLRMPGAPISPDVDLRFELAAAGRGSLGAVVGSPDVVMLTSGQEITARAIVEGRHFAIGGELGGDVLWPHFLGERRDLHPSARPPSPLLSPSLGLAAAVRANGVTGYATPMLALAVPVSTQLVPNPYSHAPLMPMGPWVRAPVGIAFDFGPVRWLLEAGVSGSIVMPDAWFAAVPGLAPYAAAGMSVVL